MSTPNGSFLERFIRAVTRGSVPVDASQCNGPCVVRPPGATSQQPDREGERQAPLRWLNLR